MIDIFNDRFLLKKVIRLNLIALVIIFLWVFMSVFIKLMDMDKSREAGFELKKNVERLKDFNSLVLRGKNDK